MLSIAKDKERPQVGTGGLILKDLSKPLLMDPVTGLQVARILCTSLLADCTVTLIMGESSVKG